jgi:hypothetical protein
MGYIGNISVYKYKLDIFLFDGCIYVLHCFTGFSDGLDEGLGITSASWTCVSAITKKLKSIASVSAKMTRNVKSDNLDIFDWMKKWKFPVDLFDFGGPRGTNSASNSVIRRFYLLPI